MNKTLYQETTEKLQSLPDPLLQEVNDFISFLLTKYQLTNGGIDTRTTDLNPETMTAIAISGGAFNWLYDPAEDGIYTDEDGEPV